MTELPASGARRPLPVRIFTSPYLLLVLTMLFWSGNWIFGRSMRHEFTPIAISYMRWMLALLLIYPFAFPHLRAQQRIIFREWKMLLALGALGIGLFHTLVYNALAATTVINASLVNSVMPIAIVAISWLMYREKITWWQALGILISSGGVVIIISRGNTEVLLNLRINKGDLWALASVPVWGLYSVLLRRRPPELHAMALLGSTMLIGVALLTPFFLWEVATQRPAPPSMESLVGGAYMALFASVLGYIFWNSAVASVGANKAGQFVHLLPVFATGLAVLILGERLYLYHLAGVAAIVIGIYLATVYGAKGKGGPELGSGN
ncbi:MAG: DMT family transporter [SAR324 cluster bacterium]|nr:DMT family transporter [SAR324 cluster bacterium]